LLQHVSLQSARNAEAGKLQGTEAREPMAPEQKGGGEFDSLLKVVDAPGVFVVGDAASVTQHGHPVPGVAQAAMQEGRCVGRLIAKELKGRKVKRPFRYFDKGTMAVVGKN
jgi:NADH dehydrogenase